MTDYQIQPPTRRCAASGRELREGERYYAVIREEGDHFVRQDFSPEGWPGPPPGTFAFWSGKVPPAEDRHKPRFDDDLLEECFQRLEGQTDPSRLNFRYVVALLLVRRKRFKFEQSVSEDGQEKMCLRGVRSGEQHWVVNPRLTEEEMTQVQEEVFRVLGWN